jgi:uncharacterized protein (DUF1697 family)
VARGWVALLRGINLGKRNKVPMAELRRVFEDAGAESVRTHIQSGNVLFEHAKPDAAKLERAVKRAFDVDATVVLRTFADIRKTARARPFGDDTSTSAVAFLAERPDRKRVSELRNLDVAPDRVKVVGSDVFLDLPNGFQGARLNGALLERTLGVPATIRNWRTVARLAELTDA